MSLLKSQKNFLESLFTYDHPLSPSYKENKIASQQRRWEVYANAYMKRIIEAIKEDFELLEKQIEEEALEEWIREAIRETPSRYWSLAELTKNFVSHIEKNKSEKYFELANYEWLTTYMYSYGNIESHLLDSLQEYKQEEILNLRPIINPSLHFYQSHWENLHKLNPKYHTDKVFYYIVFSIERKVKEFPLGKKEKKVLDAIQNGTTIGGLTKIADESILETLFLWAKNGVLINIQ